MLPGSVNCKSVYEYVNSQPNVCIEQYYPNLQCYTPPQLRFNLVQIGEGPLYGEPSLIPIDIVFIPRDVIFVNFYLLPEGKYTIQKLPRAETYTPPPKPVVYTEPTGTPVCFVDLLLTDPTCLSGGMYPVQDLWGDATIEPVSYQIRFETRATIWIYYIVPSRQKEQFEGLEIVSINHGSGAQIQPNVFGRPHKVVLNNGQFAYRFISNITIPLQEQSDFHFRLLGSPKGSAGSSGVLMDRLPVASNQQVIPEDKDFAISKPTVSQSVNRRQVGKPKIYSNIYVYV
jgi:hypothetical protein